MKSVIQPLLVVGSQQILASILLGSLLSSCQYVRLPTFFSPKANRGIKWRHHIPFYGSVSGFISNHALPGHCANLDLQHGGMERTLDWESTEVLVQILALTGHASTCRPFIHLSPVVGHSDPILRNISNAKTNKNPCLHGAYTCE